MVKILNTAGDIKIGVQGRCVYQRKNGQQIRRMREPKRAMASEAQVRHRQLYKAALAWRKSLSLANRRSLDGYAIANWIVDDHKIPLPWHRFALKLYLEHVHFTLLSKPTPPPLGPWQKFESYETGDTSNGIIRDVYWQGETFLPQAPHILDRIDVKIYRIGNGGGTAYLSLTLCDANHVPIGTPLFTTTFPANTVPLSPAAWFQITCPPATLAKDVLYGFHIHTSGGDASNQLYYRVKVGGSLYPRGQRLQSTDYGQTWPPYADQDATFKEYGTLIGPVGQLGELDIRHPALKTITRKHEGAIDQKWENLSSIDEDRITNHFTLSADLGDLITATTIAELTSTYQL